MSWMPTYVIFDTFYENNSIKMAVKKNLSILAWLKTSTSYMKYEGWWKKSEPNNMYVMIDKHFSPK